MDLFDRDDVTPPQPCSRCGVEVVATSLFCPQCGQSMVNPLPKAPVVDEPEADASSSEGEAELSTEPEVDQKRSTLSRTTEWIIKSIQRVQAGGTSPEKTVEEEDVVVREPATQAVQPGLLSDSAVRKTSSWPERLQQSSRVHTRFVLVGADGTQHTVGGNLTGLGSATAAPDGEELLWVCLGPGDTLDAFHLRCGVEDGLLWLEDNNSVYGTVIEEPGRQALQCIPFERYFVVRGTSLRLGTHSYTIQ